MTIKTPAPEQRYAQLVEALSGEAGVTFESGSGFGSESLKVDGRIFAMLVRGKLVVKLPAKRVSELIASGDGGVFDANKGKPMKEWLTVQPSSKMAWRDLAREALVFVGSKRGR